MSLFHLQMIEQSGDVIHEFHSICIAFSEFARGSLSADIDHDLLEVLRQ